MILFYHKNIEKILKKTKFIKFFLKISNKCLTKNNFYDILSVLGEIMDKNQNETKLIVLGGLGEVGKNMYVVRHNDEIIIIDNYKRIQQKQNRYSGR